ncbi:MAG TPA: hypothetical protein VNL77_10575 [Roseiflexaceae bacterium]|nr:hypothetical protein [Roseiflexaceae bacterium]
MWYPLPGAWLLPALLGALALAAIGGAAMMLRPIRRPPEAPWGIVDFELAGTWDRAEPMLQSWQASGLLGSLRFNLWADFVFLAGYATALSAGCALVATRLSGGWGALGLALTWGALAAGILDAIENVALLRTIGHFERGTPGQASGTLRLAQWCAAAKFALVIAGLLYYILGAAVGLAARSGHTS